MSFTKIAAAGIGSTETVTLHSLEVLNNATIGGVLTYEDVTNVDSIGIITARAGVLVGSGITLSKDGDGFFTGVVTATSYAGSGANLTGIDTDLVSDTSPQLGGNLDVNTKNIVFGDSGSSSDDRLQFGASQDLNIFHDGTDSHIRNNEGKLIITQDDSGGDDLHLRAKVSEESIGTITSNLDAARNEFTNLISILERNAEGKISAGAKDLQKIMKERIEGLGKEIQFTKEGRKAILNKLVEAEGLEKFLHVKYTGTKRFGLDGGEALIPAMEQIIKRGGQLGAKEIKIGMPHRLSLIHISEPTRPY